MIDLTKPYRLLYYNNEIINVFDYKEPQTGHTYPAFNISYAEFDTYQELIQFIEANQLIEREEIFNG